MSAGPRPPRVHGHRAAASLPSLSPMRTDGRFGATGSGVPRHRSVNSASTITHPVWGARERVVVIAGTRPQERRGCEWSFEDPGSRAAELRW